MDFLLTEEQVKLKQEVIEFANNVVAPLATTVDKTGQIPEEVIAQAAELNLFGIIFPKKYGGWGKGYVELAIVIEEIARVCANTAFSIASHISVGEAIAMFGTEKQKEEYLTAIIEGKYLGAFALTEPGAGSDIAAISTRAVESDHEWIINGKKIFVTNADRAGIVVTVAVVEGSGNTKDRLAMLLVPSTAPGIILGSRYNKLGMRGVSNHELFYDDCRIPLENVLGDKRKGYSQTIQFLNRARIPIAALSTGIARACLETSLSYAKKRRQFGQPISKFQAIRFKLADMATDIEMASLMTLKAAWLVDHGLPHSKESAMAKLFASEAAFKAANQAIQIHGGAAYTVDYPEERYLRDAKLMEIAEGTSEILRIIIAKQIGC